MLKIKSGLISRLSIKNKLILLVFSVLVFVFIVSFSLIIAWGIIDYKKKLEHSTLLYAKVIGEYCIAPLTFSDKQGADDVLYKIKSLPEISVAFLYDEHDSLVATYESPEFKNEEIIRPDSSLAGFHLNSLTVVEPIRYQNIHYGTIILVASTINLKKQIRNYIVLLISIFLVMMVMSYFLASRLQGYISKPILRLADFANIISNEGDYVLRISKERDDEIGHLYDRFNEMLEQIGLREEASLNAQREVRISNEKLNLILDNAPFGFLHYDQFGVVTTCNKGHEDIFKLKREDLLGKKLYDTLHDRQMRKSFDDSLHGIGSVYSGLYTSTISGVSVYCRAIYTPLFSNDNKIIGGVGIFEDISEQKRNEKLQVEKEAAVFANKAKSIFLANMSHEIRTPLNAILGFSQLMEKDQSLTPDQRENISIINSSGEHLLALINDILEMSKIEAGRIQLNSVTFNLRAMIEEVGTLFRTRAEEKKLYLLVELADDMPEYIDSDEGKIRQVLINLLSNAIKFTSEGGIILRAWTVRSPQENQLLYIEVEDTGSGIAEHELDKVFMHFEQTRSGQQAHVGTGLGLAICKEYIHMMGGEISVKSQLNKGSLFRFYIEISEGDLKNVVYHETQAGVCGIEPGQNDIKILVVDDKEPNRKLLIKMLSSVGFSLDSATNGLEAVELFKQSNPDLILMDMFMPVMDGFEAIRTIRALPGGKEVKIFAVTASVFEEDKQNILESGADEFIKKPFKEYEIFEKISDRLGVKFISQTQETSIEKQVKIEPLTVEMISLIPPRITDQIKEAIINGDIEMMEEHIKQLSSIDRMIATQLLSLVKTYNFEKLNQIFQIT